MLLSTSTVIAQEAWVLFMAAPAITMLPAPTVAVTTPVPEGQVVVMLGVAATVTLAHAEDMAEMISKYRHEHGLSSVGKGYEGTVKTNLAIAR